MPIGKQIVKGGLRLAEEASKAQRMSEALNPHVGKRLYITQADRTALDYNQGLLGGPGYVELAGIDPEKYKDIAWAVQSPGVAKTMVGSMARNPEEAVWSNLIGSPEQHRSNKVVFDRIMNQFEKAIQEDKLTPELRDKINARLASIKDPKTGKAFFPEDVDILSPEFQQHAQTFHQRATIADILAGRGVGGQKGKIIPYEDIIKETTDPLLLEAKTGDIGDRLFSLSGNIQERPELHPAFHYSLSGRKESEAFKPAPQGIVLQDFIKEFSERTGRLPTYYDLTRGYAPNVKITDEMLERMYKEGYAKGGAVEDDELIKSDPTAYLMNEVKPVDTSISSGAEFRKKVGSPSELLKSILGGAYNESKEYKPRALTDIPINAVSELVGMPIDIASELQTNKITPIRSDIVLPRETTRLPVKTLPLSSEAFKKATTDIGLTSGEDYPYAQGAVSLLGAPEAKAISKGVGTLAVKGAKGAGKAIAEGIERNVIPLAMKPQDMQMNIIKDQGGMLVGGERDLDNELLNMKKTERPGATFESINAGTAPKDPNAVALNNWIDTKVKKYLRNQAGSEADPILKAIDSGVEYNFTPEHGNTKYVVANRRQQVGKPAEGIAKTDLGKEWEYKVDSIFKPTKSEDIKEILNRPLPEETDAQKQAAVKFKSSLLRMEHDLPVHDANELEALKLIHQIPDEHVYSVFGTDIVRQLNFDHMADVLMSDLEAGKLTPEKLNQMSMEKAVRRVAEFDAEQARIASKAEADTIKDLPIHNTYDKGYRWIELDHPTDPSITKKALVSESDQMGHCVGRLDKYFNGVQNGTKKIYSLRDANNKPHVTIEENIYRNPDAFVKANADTIANDPDLSKIQWSDDVDYRYSDATLTEEELNNNFVGELIRTMKKKGLPINEDPSTTYSIINQVKGKENTRPNERYQDYITEFLTNPPIKHDVAEIKELAHTNLMDANDVAHSGIVSKDIHFSTDAMKATKARNPKYTYGMSKEQEDMRYELFKEAAKDLAKKGKGYFSKNDLLNHIRETYLQPKQAPVNRIDMNFKDVTKRIPELTEGANKLSKGEITAQDYDQLVNTFKPVEPYTFVPQPATAEDAMRALTKNKQPMFGKLDQIKKGEQTDLRLDIPAYKDHGVWINSIHRKNAPTIYGSVSSVKNAVMVGSPDKALKVATGEASKSPFAVIRGQWNPTEEKTAVENAKKYLNDKDWVQVGYDPERHGYFYDRTTMQPIQGAEEVLQIGPLVLAKKPKYAIKSEQKFAKGGEINLQQEYKLENMRRRYG